MKGLTPMMQQYFQIKEQHKDHILFYRLGDFYEMFFDDAITASRELELTLTGRQCGLPERAPMAGVPYHSADNYIAKLINKGYKVAICEQVEDASEAKGLVERRVVRVITPGTVMESNLLDESTNNFLCSIYQESDGFGLAFADISTGEVNLIALENDQREVINELTRYFPKEVIFNSAFLDSKLVTSFIKEQLLCTADILDDDKFSLTNATELILSHFDKESLEELGINEDKTYVNALGGLLSYLHETQKTGVERLINLRVQSNNRFMNLDRNARTHLELVETYRTKEKRGSLLWVVDKTKTPMGKRLIRSFISQPLINAVEIEARLDAVEELYKDEMLCGDIQDVLTDIHDVERLITRIVYGSANPREYKTLQQTIEKFPGLKRLVDSSHANNLIKIHDDIDELTDLTDFLERSLFDEPSTFIRDGGVVEDGFDEELDQLRDLIANARTHLSKLESEEKEKSGIKNLKIGFNKVFGYYFEVTKSNLDQVPDYFVRKQTLANSERYITDELKVLEDKITHAHERALVVEAKLFEDIRIFTIKRLNRIQKSASAIAHLDVYLSFAKVSLDNHYTRPVIDLSKQIEITEGRHPVVEKMLSSTPFVPNDTCLDTDENMVAIITGPNMAGKSTYMRQTALIVLMAQMGCFVPAEYARVGIVDGIYTRIGASDDLTAGQSTFMVEMKEMAEILKSATSDSLIILDEIGRGTSTYDGMSIARAVIEYIANPKRLGAKTLFATHYHELTIMENDLQGVKNYHIVAKKRGDDIIFLRRIVRGGTDDSYGIEVSKLAGIPNWIVKRAHEVLLELEENRPISTVKLELEEDPQLTLGALSNENSRINEMLNALDVETLTPIEALNILYEIKNIHDSK